MRKKLSFILVLVFLANLLLPGISLATEINNSVVPSELSNVDNGQTLLSPDTSQGWSQTNTPQSNTNSDTQTVNQEGVIVDKILEPQSSSSNVEAQNAARVILLALEYVIKKMGPVMKNKVWPVVKKKLDNLVKKYDDLRVRGPGGGERVFALFNNNVEIFRLDARLLPKNKNGDYYLYVHYHITPNMKLHNDIGTFYIGKIKPPGYN